VYTVGAPRQAVRVLLDPQALAGHGIDLADLRRALQGGNLTRDNLAVTADNQEVLVQAGTFLSTPEEIGDLVVGLHGGRPVSLSEVASVERGPEQLQSYVWMGAGPGAHHNGIDLSGTTPAVTVAVAKQEGINAVAVAERVIERLAQLDGTFIPQGVEVTVTRNYGATADTKAKKLISKLTFATASVILLVVVAIGWRESIIVGAAVVVTLALTLFASWAWGFTLNRVSLFALIFSIGILVDDAIVVVENIHRHMALSKARLLDLMPRAVDEVGGPTILATFTVIAALLPMAFVSGLMGPYMSPIPINASTGMLISLVVAFVFTPWMTNFMLGKRHAAQGGGGDQGHGHEASAGGGMQRFFDRVIGPFLLGAKGNLNRWLLLAGILILIAGSIWLVTSKVVILKMLPFDNKSEFQVVLDMPEGTSLEQTSRVLAEMGDYLSGVPEVTDYQAYAGTATPINFNGLVRQYYLRSGGELGDLQVNLVDKHHRDRKSHEIVVALRPALAEIGRRHDASVQVVEVPPGPPVMAPIVAEIYGPSYESQREL
ncbi:MAG TPA: efflux RND transporter permease subunit, partial [Chromatiaceae bacterium]|nr:efflux RND transporter permease subunit [Chromatiaceae bacterium]